MEILYGFHEECAPPQRGQGSEGAFDPFDSNSQQFLVLLHGTLESASCLFMLFWLSSITELLFEIPLFKYSQARFIFSFECFMRIMGNPLVFKQNGKLCLPSNTVLYIVISTHFYMTLSWNKTPYNEVLDLGSALLTCENNFRVALCIHSCENK